MPDNESAQLQKEKVLSRLFEHHKIEKSKRTSSRTLEWATSALDYWLRTDGSITSPEVQVLIEVIEEEVRWLKRRNDEADRRAANPLRVSKRLTIQTAPPAQLPKALYKAMKRVGFTYDTSTQTWSAWDSEEAQVIMDSLQEQGQLW
tara:strand:- start:1235 stop:1675 length:441 start_codon:yes stop_codon:yes gene_type:complete